MIVHNFTDSLAKSKVVEDDPLWESVYYNAFEGVERVTKVSDPEQNKLGVDRLVWLSNGNVIRIEEKGRGEKYNDKQDFFLETISNDRTMAAGWIEKDLACDYVAYGFIGTRRCYLLPWHLLRRAWIKYGSYWVDEYGTRESPNKDYITVGVPVPIKVVESAIMSVSFFQVD